MGNDIIPKTSPIWARLRVRLSMRMMDGWPIVFSGFARTTGTGFVRVLYKTYPVLKHLNTSLSESNELIALPEC
jgi:hypothetical protein